MQSGNGYTGRSGATSRVPGRDGGSASEVGTGGAAAGSNASDRGVHRALSSDPMAARGQLMGQQRMQPRVGFEHPGALGAATSVEGNPATAQRGQPSTWSQERVDQSLRPTHPLNYGGNQRLEANGPGRFGTESRSIATQPSSATVPGSRGQTSPQPLARSAQFNRAADDMTRATSATAPYLGGASGQGASIGSVVSAAYPSNVAREMPLNAPYPGPAGHRDSQQQSMDRSYATQDDRVPHGIASNQASYAMPTRATSGAIPGPIPEAGNRFHNDSAARTLLPPHAASSRAENNPLGSAVARNAGGPVNAIADTQRFTGQALATERQAHVSGSVNADSNQRGSSGMPSSAAAYSAYTPHSSAVPNISRYGTSSAGGSSTDQTNGALNTSPRHRQQESTRPATTGSGPSNAPHPGYHPSAPGLSTTQHGERAPAVSPAAQPAAMPPEAMAQSSSSYPSWDASRGVPTSASSAPRAPAVTGTAARAAYASTPSQVSAQSTANAVPLSDFPYSGAAHETLAHPGQPRGYQAAYAPATMASASTPAALPARPTVAMPPAGQSRSQVTMSPAGQSFGSSTGLAAPAVPSLSGEAPRMTPFATQPFPSNTSAPYPGAVAPATATSTSAPMGLQPATAATYYGTGTAMAAAPSPMLQPSATTIDYSTLPRPALDPNTVMYRVWFGDPLQRELLWPQQVATGELAASAGAYNQGLPPAGMPFEPQINFCAFDPTWCCPVELFRPCHPSRMRLSTNYFPNSAATRSKTGLPLAAIVRPLAPPLSDDPADQVPVVNFGAAGIVRCRRCRTYINFGVTFTDGGRRWRCNICQLLNDIPPEYYSPLDANGKRHDIAERVELCSGSVEFVAPSEYMIRPPQPPVYVFVLDVSYGSIVSGAFFTFLETIRHCLDSLPQDGRTRVAVLLFDTQLTYCALPAGELAEPRFLVAPDVEDVFLPTPEDVLASLDDSRPALLKLLDKLETIYDPAVFQAPGGTPSNALASGAAFGSAVMGAFYVMQHWGGKMVVLSASRPTMGIAKLKDRDDAYALFTDREARLLTPEEGQYKRIAVDFVRAQVSVDLFLTPPSGAYVDVASLSCLSKYTGGECLYLSAFEATRDGARLARALHRSLSRETGFEAVFRLRASNGVRCSRFHGRFFTRSSDLLAQPNVDADKTYVVELNFEEAQLTNRYLCAQSALLYTSSRGERRIRVHTVVAPVTSAPNELYRSADVNVVVSLLARALFEQCTTQKPDAVRRMVIDQVVDILAKYRQLLSSPGSVTSSQLVLPDALRCLPLYALGIVRSALLSRDAAATIALRIDCKAALLQALDNGSVGTLMAFAYPNCIRLEDGSGVRASASALSGIMLIDAGFEVFVWVALDVPPPLLVALVGPEITSLLLAQPPPAHLPSPKALGEELLRLPYHQANDRGHEMRRRLHAVLEARTDAMPVVSLVRQGSPAEARVLTLMNEDRTSSEMGYIEFLAAIQRQLQQRLSGSSSSTGS